MSRRVLAVSGYHRSAKGGGVGVLVHDGGMQYPICCLAASASWKHIFLLSYYIGVFARTLRSGDTGHIWFPSDAHHMLREFSGDVPCISLRKRIERIRRYLFEVRARVYLHTIDQERPEHAALVEGMDWGVLAGRAAINDTEIPSAPLLRWEEIECLSVNDPDMMIVRASPRQRVYRLGGAYCET